MGKGRWGRIFWGWEVDGIRRRNEGGESEMGEFGKYEYVSLPHPLISLYTQMYNMYVYLHPLKLSLSLSLSHSFSLYLSLFLSLPLPHLKLSVHLSLASFPKYQNLHLT